MSSHLEQKEKRAINVPLYDVNFRSAIEAVVVVMDVVVVDYADDDVMTRSCLDEFVGTTQSRRQQ